MKSASLLPQFLFIALYLSILLNLFLWVGVVWFLRSRGVQTSNLLPVAEVYLALDDLIRNERDPLLRRRYVLLRFALFAAFFVTIGLLVLLVVSTPHTRTS